MERSLLLRVTTMMTRRLPEIKNIIKNNYVHQHFFFFEALLNLGLTRMALTEST